MVTTTQKRTVRTISSIKWMDDIVDNGGNGGNSNNDQSIVSLASKFPKTNLDEPSFIRAIAPKNIIFTIIECTMIVCNVL